MVKVTESYIKGSVGTDAPYVDQITSLEKPLNVLNEANCQLILNQEFESANELTSALEALFETDNLHELIVSEEYQQQLMRLQNSFNALTVINNTAMAHCNHLLSAIMVCHVTEWIQIHPDSNISTLQSARVVLNKPSYPLAALNKNDEIAVNVLGVAEVYSLTRRLMRYQLGAIC